MLIIRNSQLQVFGEQQSLQFIDAAFSHLERCFPGKLETLGEAVARDVIRRGIDRARRHGFTTQRLVCRFIDLTLVLGVEFDQDLRWAVEILQRHDLPADERMQLLFPAAIQHLKTGRTS
jgi:hypothetical protein